MKIVTIGAGSLVWGPTVNTDFLLNEALDGAELMLMDTNADTLRIVKRYLDRLVQERAFSKMIRATTDLEEALTDADYVLVAISVGGDRLWRYDAIFPQIYGIFQPVGDTVGPGGMMRALRHIPPILEIARTLRRVGKGEPVLIQLTNPMNPICAALQHVEGVRVYGLCHGVWDTEAIIARQLEIPQSSVHVNAAGNNHHIYCTEVRISDRVYGQEELHELTPAVFDTPFRAEVFRRYGGLVGNNTRHPIEFLPNFLTPQSGFGRDWGTSPIAWEIDPMRGEPRDNDRKRLADAILGNAPLQWAPPEEGAGVQVRDDRTLRIGHSHEVIDGLLAALEQGHEFAVHLNLPNRGTIEGVGAEHNVEIPVTLRRGAVERPHIRFANFALTAEVERVATEQTLIARAAVEGDRGMLVDALAMDALVPNRDIAERLVKEMTLYQRDYIDPALLR